MDLKQIFESKTPAAIGKVKGITPEIRLAYTFHLIERKKKEVEEPVKAVKRIMEESGAKVESVTKNNRGYMVKWSSNDYNIITQIDNKFKVVHAGFCTSSYDHTQSARSVVHLLRDYADRRVSSGD